MFKLASNHYGLLIIPIHWLLHHCLLSTSKLVCGGHSGAIWLSSHHPGGCCTLVVDEKISYYVKLWVPWKALYKCNILLIIIIIVTKKFLVPIDMQNIYSPILWKTMATTNCLVTNILITIFFYVKQKKWLLREHIFCQVFWVNWCILISSNILD